MTTTTTSEVRRLVATWRRRAAFSEAGYAHAYRNCADELEAALSQESGATSTFIRQVRENALRLQRQYKLSSAAAMQEAFEAIAENEAALSHEPGAVSMRVAVDPVVPEKD
jgi:hypothetical protein